MLYLKKKEKFPPTEYELNIFAEGNPKPLQFRIQNQNDVFFKLAHRDNVRRFFPGLLWSRSTKSVTIFTLLILVSGKCVYLFLLIINFLVNVFVSFILTISSN